MDYNICIMRPDGYIHSLAFLELGELIHYSLRDLGFETDLRFFNTDLRFNAFRTDCKNVLIGCHLLDPKLIPVIPKPTIVFNTEQIYTDTMEWNSIIFQWARRFEVWDYSTRNISKFHELGIKHVRHFMLGFQKELVRIKSAAVKDIDILFYGSFNDRRKKIFDSLGDRGYLVHTAFGIYGEERDDLISRAKIVLNLHLHNAEIFEIVRVFYLLTNSKAVVAEVNDGTSIDPVYIDGIYPSPYENLADACIKLVEDDKLRAEIEAKALSTIQQLPQYKFTSNVLEPP